MRNKIEADMIINIMSDIKALNRKMLMRATDIIEPDINSEGIDLAELARKKQVRDIRAILKDKMETLTTYYDAKRISADFESLKMFSENKNEQ